MIIYVFITLVILYHSLDYLYYIFLVKGIFKINIGEYSIRRIKYSLCEKDIDELKHIAINSVGIVPQNPIFSNKNIDNKIVLIVYHNNKPVGLNIMFDYEYENNTCLHVGLVLIDKEYQGKRIQEYTKYNGILFT